MEGDISSYSAEQEYSNHFDKAEKYVLEAVELSKKLEDLDEYISAKIAIAQAKLKVMETVDLAAVPAGVFGVGRRRPLLPVSRLSPVDTWINDTMPRS